MGTTAKRCTPSSTATATSPTPRPRPFWRSWPRRWLRRDSHGYDPALFPFHPHHTLPFLILSYSALWLPSRESDSDWHRPKSLAVLSHGRRRPADMTDSDVKVLHCLSRFRGLICTLRLPLLHRHAAQTVTFFC